MCILIERPSGLFIEIFDVCRRICKFVVDKQKRIQGLLFADKAAKALQAGDNTVISYLNNDYAKVPPKTYISDMFDLMANVQGCCQQVLSY